MNTRILKKGALLAMVLGMSATPGIAGNFSMGPGVGIPYGVIGVAAEYDIPISDNFSIAPTAGIGSAINGFGYNVGAQGFFGNTKDSFRLGVGVWYGVNTIVDGWTDDDVGHGVSMGFTPRFQLGNDKNHLINLHLLYAVSRNYDDPCIGVPARFGCVVDDPGRVSGGIGYMFKF